MVTNMGTAGSAKSLSPYRPKSALALATLCGEGQSRLGSVWGQTLGWATYLPIGMLEDMAVSVNWGSFSWVSL